MPPIMGAAAFLMADFVGVPYSNIIVRAILPALLYFTGIFISVHLEAKKLGLSGIPKEKLPVFKLLIRKIYLLLPLVMLVIWVSGNYNDHAEGCQLCNRSFCYRKSFLTKKTESVLPNVLMRWKQEEEVLSP